jgi:hypothetical protein
MTSVDCTPPGIPNAVPAGTPEERSADSPPTGRQARFPALLLRTTTCPYFGKNSAVLVLPPSFSG